MINLNPVAVSKRHVGLMLGVATCALFLSACGGGGGGGGSDQGGAAQKTAQSINFGVAPDLVVSGTGSVAATSTSGLPVTYSSSTPAVCTVDASTGTVTVLATGTCTIVATQGGNDQYAPAEQTTLNIVVKSGSTQQTIAFAPAPTLSFHGVATVTATATSGLSVAYSSTTPSVCSVDRVTGVVTDLTQGTCTVAADQAGSADYAPAAQVTQSLTVVVSRSQTITFGAAPAVTAGSTATVTATASSGLPVVFAVTTPGTCTINGTTGMLVGLAAGSCIVTADQAGNADFDPAPQVSQTLTIAPAPVKATAPGIPTGVKAELGVAGNTVIVTVGATDSGGSAITGFTAVSSPAGLTGTATKSPITVTCPTSCAGYAFTVYASNEVGNGKSSAAVDVITNFKVVETFLEPATQPNNSIFTGTFTLNSTKKTVSNLQGNLTESMTTDSSDPNCNTIQGCPGGYGKVPMTLVPLTHQLYSANAMVGGVDGLLVASFALTTTDTFYKGSGTADDPYNDGWSPQVGADVGGIYFGWPSALNPYKGGVGNSYALIFVNLGNPVAPLTQLQIDKLAYADCAAGGMMGAVCMTGTTVAGYGAVGTMAGFPLSQVITKQ